LKQFSYVTSHNLRAPIANLLGLTSLIDQYKIPNKSLKQIIDGVRQSALMFDDTVKDLSKVLIIKDQTNIVKEEVSFVLVIENVLKQLSIAMDDNTVKINYEFSNAPSVLFIPSYMESILLNLFTNAIKYKSLKRNLKIDIISSNVDGFVILKFKDNGIGIDIEKYKDKLFKLYQRFHDNPDGKGLGLYLVKSQLEVLGGSIAVESEVGKGTTFIMKFRK
jgi:signal transduction histidine kinase